MVPIRKHLDIPEALAAGVTGTTFMTLFSYLVSEAKDRNFKEPELLGTLLRRILPTMSKSNSQLSGWALHYVVGILFAMFYVWLWNGKMLKASGKSGIGLGAVSGVIGALVWHLTFRLHPSPPKTSYRKYYGHLVVTHIVFGLFALIGYQLTKRFRHKQALITERRALRKTTFKMPIPTDR